MKSVCLIAATCGLALMQGCGKKSGKNDKDVLDKSGEECACTAFEGVRCKAKSIKDAKTKSERIQKFHIERTQKLNESSERIQKFHESTAAGTSIPETRVNFIKFWEKELKDVKAQKKKWEQDEMLKEALSVEELKELLKPLETRIEDGEKLLVELIEDSKQHKLLVEPERHLESGKTEKVSPSNACTDVSTEPQSTFGKMARICNDFVRDLDKVHDAQTYKRKLRLYHDNSATQFEIGMRDDSSNADGLPEFQRACKQVDEKMAATKHRLHLTPEDAGEVVQIELQIAHALDLFLTNYRKKDVNF